MAMRASFVPTLLSENVLSVAETRIRRGSVTVSYGDEQYVGRRPLKRFEAGGGA